ncbi:uncharacterized protein LOC129760382 [Uranotaenia lowii]|uniref:uncharacterized protein LOC129760382 n=1 Tax=Uranotaenia lowii TaxID=190385 RepID=UPI002479C45E|nr:uncharacterized protein LOC129760382 [Uranotaenia lowii]
MERLRQLKEQSQRMHEQFLLLDESIVSHSGELINSGRRSVGAIPKQPMMSTRYETLVASRVQGSKGSGISSLKGSQHSTKTREQKLKALEARQALERKQLDERLQLEEQLSAGLDTDSETSESVQRVENWLNKTHNIENATAMPGNETTLPEYPGRVAKSVRIQLASDSSKSSAPRAALAAATSNIMPTCSTQSSATIPSIPPLYGLQSSGSADPQFAFPLSNPSSTSMCVPSLPSGAFQGSVNLPQNHHQSYPSACPPSSFPVQQYPPVYTTQQPRVAVSQQQAPRSVIGTSQPDLVDYSNPYATQSGSNLPPVSASTPRRLSLFPQQQTIADEVCSIERRLSAEHLAARQTVKDLPKFGGDPEEWPRFIAAYERTARMCDFRNDELLDRLERSLQDRALSTVKSLLLHPDNVPVIMNRLSTLFGNPETIVDTMMKRVKSMPPPKADKLESIIDFGIAVQNLCATILACRLDERLYNATLLQELVESLPINLKMKWATHLQKTGASSLMEFNMWLSKKVDAFSRVTRPQSWNKSSAKHRKDEAFLHLHSEQPSSRSYQNSCPACSGDCATIENCRAFLDMSKNQRWSVVNEQNICRKCLTRHFKTCSRRVPCNTNGCKYLHHWLLHDDRKHKEQNNPNIPNIPANNAISPNNPISPSNSSSMLQHPSCNAHNCSLGGVLLKYIRVTLHGRKGSITTYAFLDGGSTSTFMEHGLWQDLNLEGEKYPLCISWTAGQGRFEADSVKCSIEISGMQSDERFNLAKVHTVQSLSLPSQTPSGAELIRRYHYLSDIPIDSYANVRPRILLGMDNIRLEYPLDSREGLENEPTAVLTRLGWVVYGPCSKSDDYRSSEKRLAYNYHVCQCDELHLTVKEYFSLDSLGIRLDTNRILSKDDERALALLEKNTNRQGARYETCLLWRYDNVDLPSSKTMALNRHKCLERRLIREPEVAKALQQKILEYETKGYIRQLTTKEENEHHERCWYLPIFPVVNPNKPGKLRIVWDAAAKVGKVSLNSFLLKGPDQVAPLSHVLRRFREYRVAITGDIREMFHQVRINSRDQHCQRFLWNKGSPGEAPTTYVMDVMTFGASCSPSSAQYVKNLNSKRFNEQYPKAADEIENGTYVDDMLCSVETEEEAIDLAKNVRMIHASGGFEIRGWLSNSRNVMEAMGECTPVSKDLDVGSQLATEKMQTGITRWLRGSYQA